ncbi:S41 family peptidase [Indiicoccus explosivorum]|uniref:S41 family peptidase n=1 Tax=Indiicoccus explosivorum TaxID=1917864 RepID=UPI000B44439F|nr:S41 family peptidase [Indiicoccus explosivorum]
MKEILNKEEVLAFYDKGMELLKQNYVYPEAADSICRQLAEQVKQLDLSKGISRTEFKQTVEQAMQSVNHDKHLHIFYQTETHTEISPDTVLDDHQLKARKTNYGFHRIERLPGNIGYLDLRVFYENEIASETAAHAMNALAHTDALIIDLRKNLGGTPYMVAFLASYFVSEPTHIDTFYRRDEDSHSQIWTLPYVPGILYGDKPLYILTSRQTFSAGELFSYALKHLNRAEIIGERTGGGANAGNYHQVTENIRLFIPSGMPVSPFTGSNWDGTGVEPDVEIPADEAFGAAYTKALTAVEKTYAAQADYAFLIEEIKKEKETNPLLHKNGS